MCKNLESLSVLGAEIGLTSTSEAQTGLTDPPTGQSGLAIPDSPILENSTSSDLERDKADVVDWRRPIMIICKIQITRLIERFGGLLSSSQW
jgi:hypothetical protein